MFGRTNIITTQTQALDMASEQDQINHSRQIKKGSSLGNRHKVEAFLGEGGFGFVAKCRNTETGKAVAVKINKSHPNIIHQTRAEIAILKRLRCLDPDTCNIVKWNGLFFDKAQICLEFELLDQNLHSYMKNRKNRGLPMAELRPIIRQLATALSHLSSMGIVHGDVKPDNVLIVDRHEQPLRVKLIDFGLACPVSGIQQGMCLQTTWYRAPEVMLQAPFNEAIDMWSLGLTAIELATGYTLYPGSMDYDMLHFIIETQGQPPDHVLDQGMGTDHYFNQQNNGQPKWRFKRPNIFEFLTGFRPMETRDVKLKSLDDIARLMATERDRGDRHLFIDLVKRMLHLDPDQRIKPAAVLQHPFLTYGSPESRPAESLREMPPVDGELPKVELDKGCNSHHLGAQSEVVIETDAQPDTQHEGWLRRFARKMMGTFCYYCPAMG